MKNLTRFLTLAVVICLCLTSFAFAEESAIVPGYDEFNTHHDLLITWFEQGWTGLDEDLDVVTPEIERRTNLHMGYEAMTVPTGDDYTQKLNLMISSGDVPDVFFGGNDAYTRLIYQKLGETGKIWDLHDILQDYPNLYELVYPELTLYETEDGANYFIPTQTGRGYENLNEPPHGLFIRQDFLDQLGMEMPTTPDELYNYLKRATEEIEVDGRKVTGLLMGENMDGINQLYEMFFPLLGAHDSYTLPFDVENGYKVCNYEYTNSPELMAAAKYVNKLSREGLLDRETLTLKISQYQEKASNGRCAAMTAAWWDMNTFTDVAKDYYPELMWIAPVPIFASEEIAESRLMPWTDWVGCWSSLIISKNVDEEVLRHLLAVMDYFVSQEGQLLVTCGIEGVTYEWKEDGTYEYLPEFVEATNGLDWNRAAAYGVFYYQQMVCNVPELTPLQNMPSALTREDNYLSWANQQVKRDVYDKHMEPTLDYYFIPGDVENELLPAIRDAKTEFWAKIVAASSEEEVENIVNEWGVTCQNMGIDQVIAERQAFIDALIAEQAN